MNRRVTWGEILCAALLGALVILAQQKGAAAQFSSLLLRGLGTACFVLFASWFSRAVYLSVQGAPDYALFGYSMLVFCLLSWGLAFLYPFPLHSWRDLLLRDLAFFVGVSAPLALLLLLAAGKLLISPVARGKLKGGFHTLPQNRWKLGLAAVILLWFLGLCGMRTLHDIQDLRTEPLTITDTLVGYYQATRSGDDTATFVGAGTLRVPHGLQVKFLERHRHYKIRFTPHARLLVGIQPE